MSSEVTEKQIQQMDQASVAIPEYLRQVSVMLAAIDANEEEKIFADIPDNLNKIAEFTEGLMGTVNKALVNHGQETAE